MIQLLSLVFLGFLFFIVLGIAGWILKAIYWLLSLLGEGFSGCLGCFVYIFIFIFLGLLFTAII